MEWLNFNYFCQLMIKTNLVSDVLNDADEEFKSWDCAKIIEKVVLFKQ